MVQTANITNDIENKIIDIVRNSPTPLTILVNKVSLCDLFTNEKNHSILHFIRDMVRNGLLISIRIDFKFGEMIFASHEQMIKWLETSLNLEQAILLVLENSTTPLNVSYVFLKVTEIEGNLSFVAPSHNKVKKTLSKLKKQGSVFSISSLVGSIEEVVYYINKNEHLNWIRERKTIEEVVFYLLDEHSETGLTPKSMYDWILANQEKLHFRIPLSGVYCCLNRYFKDGKIKKLNQSKRSPIYFKY
jgi:virulence-associated protein VapD